MKDVNRAKSWALYWWWEVECGEKNIQVTDTSRGDCLWKSLVENFSAADVCTPGVPVVLGIFTFLHLPEWCRKSSIFSAWFLSPFEVVEFGVVVTQQLPAFFFCLLCESGLTQIHLRFIHTHTPPPQTWGTKLGNFWIAEVDTRRQ